MDLHTVLRSRITAAAVGATVLGVSAALVPTVSTALVTSTAASAIVTWTDSADDFTAAPTGTFPLTDQWYWASVTDLDGGGSIADHATLDEDGLSVSEGEAVGLVRGLNKPVPASSVPALAAGISMTTTGATSFGLAVQEGGDTSAQTVVFATDAPETGDGVGISDGTSNWIDPATGEVESTTELTADLEAADAQVVGYVVYVGIDVAADTTAPPTPEPTETPAPTDEPTPAPTVDGTPAPSALPSSELKSLAAPLEANGQSLAADASGSISALRIDDTTTYFTPQPTATADAPTSVRVSQTLTGFQVTGAGFAPNESVAATITQGGETYSIRTNASVADDEGDIVVVVVLPEGAVSAGAYTATLEGRSSTQTASADGAFIADPAAAGDPGTAPVAVPVPGTANFTG
ncbi:MULTISPECIES: hypothetical protein [unclassified Curtobacterium]|uniref:hypothetical protein n=1 Tax=unclassified Curtobacterium TaxID=257496 RepID=UPI000DAA7ADE|nr:MULTISPECIES: hypothetical protein [unclassified Curtobacterium]PZF37188.1 hypothetical protein DEJ07_15885 [Curtobacterium sp. MCLR17_053]PZF47591.1 hypothetical protein DEJ06_14265 [Curtobacterium sp. MCLR17_051]